MVLDNIDIIIFEMLRNLFSEYYASDIAKKLNLDQKTTANCLYKLEKEKYLKSRVQGRNRLFSWNFDDKNKLLLFLYSNEIKKKEFLIEKSLSLKEIISKLDSILNKYLIFGSYSKNLEKDCSDLDILVIGDYDKNKVKEISLMFEIEINIRKLSHEKLIKQLKEENIFLNEIVKDHVIMRGFEYFTDIFVKYYYRK